MRPRSSNGGGQGAELTRNLYITGMEAGSGKSVVALGIMELLSARVERLGFFRPIVPSLPDPQIELIRRRYQLEHPHDDLYALTEDEANAIDEYGEQRKRVVHAYRPLAERCDFVLIEGSDFTRRRAGGRLRPECRPGERARRSRARRRQGRRAGRDRRGCPRRARLAGAQGLHPVRRRGQPGAAEESADEIAALLERRGGDPIYVLREQSRPGPSDGRRGGGGAAGRDPRSSRRRA